MHAVEHAAGEADRDGRFEPRDIVPPHRRGIPGRALHQVGQQAVAIGGRRHHRERHERDDAERLTTEAINDSSMDPRHDLERRR